MSRRIGKLFIGLMAAGPIGKAVWAWYGADRPHQAGTPPGHGQTSPPPGSEVRPPSMEPIQMHLLPRSQPTPLSPSFRPPPPAG
jgi:hypothetical protein